ncbi:MAG: hypothetical protein Tsb0015_08150 [Simkaniaceae bacterium]
MSIELQAIFSNCKDLRLELLSFLSLEELKCLRAVSKLFYEKVNKDLLAWEAGKYPKNWIGILGGAEKFQGLEKQGTLTKYQENSDTKEKELEVFSLLQKMPIGKLAKVLVSSAKEQIGKLDFLNDPMCTADAMLVYKNRANFTQSTLTTQKLDSFEYLCLFNPNHLDKVVVYLFSNAQPHVNVRKLIFQVNAKEQEELLKKAANGEEIPFLSNQFKSIPKTYQIFSNLKFSRAHKEMTYSHPIGTDPYPFHYF